jgi:lipid II:glycine glycyltransferase (peptidoglycan interpeptide bridge formation enzyme)
MSKLIFEQPSATEYSEAWKRFSGHFPQSPSWALFKAKTGLKSFWFCGRDTSSEIVIAGQGFLVPTLGKFYAYFPYGPFVNPAKITSNYVEQFVEKVNESFGTAFVRIEPGHGFLSGLELKGKPTIGSQPKSSLIVNTTLGDLLLKNMHQKTRYNIGLAQRHGCHFRNLDSEEQQAGIKLISDTALRQDYRDHGVDYYNLLLKFGQEQVETQVKMNGVYFDGKLLAVGIFVDCLQTRTYLFGGSSEENRNVMAPYLLHWKSILEAKDLGISSYDFWGLETSSEKEAGFSKFKQGFGGDTVKYPGAYDYPSSNAWYAIYSILRKIARKSR